jgi:putative transposase
MLKRKKSTKVTKLTRTYQFRLYPTRKQTRTLEQWLVLCCETYNAALDERKSAYRMAGISLSYEDQCAELPGCKYECPQCNLIIHRDHNGSLNILADALRACGRAG